MDGERKQLVDNIRIAIENKKSEKDVLQAAAELIHAFSKGFDWTGFYMMKDSALEVGPYIGPETPHTRIELNAGICGAAASQKKSVIVDDVTGDARFLACSPNTKSEIVIPLMDGELVIGEIDIDSNKRAFFTDDDRKMFEEVASTIVVKLKTLES